MAEPFVQGRHNGAAQSTDVASSSGGLEQPSQLALSSSGLEADDAHGQTMPPAPKDETENADEAREVEASPSGAERLENVAAIAKEVPPNGPVPFGAMASVKTQGPGAVDPDAVASSADKTAELLDLPAHMPDQPDSPRLEAARAVTQRLGETQAAQMTPNVGVPYDALLEDVAMPALTSVGHTAESLYEQRKAEEGERDPSTGRVPGQTSQASGADQSAQHGGLQPGSGDSGEEQNGRGEGDASLADKLDSTREFAVRTQQRIEDGQLGGDETKAQGSSGQGDPATGAESPAVSQGNGSEDAKQPDGLADTIAETSDDGARANAAQEPETLAADAEMEVKTEDVAGIEASRVVADPTSLAAADSRTDRQIEDALDEAVEAKVKQLDRSETALLEPQPPYNPVETPVNDVIYHFFRYVAERHKVWHRKEVLKEPKPWTNDPIIPEGRYGNVFRQLDRGSIAMQQDVIEKGDQSHEEICFRIFLNNAFCNRRTWNRWEVELGETPSLKNFDVKRYSQILDPIVARGDIIYSSEFQLVPPRYVFGANSSTMSGHTASLKLVQVMLEVDLARRLKDCKYLCDASALVQSIPTMGGFLSMNLVMDLVKSPTLKLAARDFASCGPGSREGLRRIFGASINGTIMDNAALRWLERNQWKYWARLGEEPPHAPGLRPGLRVLDFENALCWHHRYLRVQLSKGLPIQSPPEFDAAITDNVVAPEWPADSEENMEPPPPPEGDAYEVEKVVDSKGTKFRVRWVGYPPEDDTWEPEHSLSSGAEEALNDWKSWQKLISDKVVEVSKRKTPGLKVVSKGQGSSTPRKTTTARTSKQLARRHSQAKAPPIASPRKARSSAARTVASPVKGRKSAASAASTPARRSASATTPRSAAKSGTSASKKRKAPTSAHKRSAREKQEEEEEEEEEEEWDELDESEEEVLPVKGKKAKSTPTRSKTSKSTAKRPRTSASSSRSTRASRR